MMRVSERVTQLELTGSRQRIVLFMASDSREVVDSFLLEYPTARIYVVNMSGESRWGNPEMNQGRLQFMQVWGVRRLVRALSVLPTPDLIVDATGATTAVRSDMAAGLVHWLSDGGHYVSCGSALTATSMPTDVVTQLDAVADMSVWRKVGDHAFSLTHENVVATLDAALGSMWGQRVVSPSGELLCYRDVTVSPSSRVTLGNYVLPTTRQESNAQHLGGFAPQPLGEPASKFLSGAYFLVDCGVAAGGSSLKTQVEALVGDWQVARKAEPDLKVLLVGPEPLATVQAEHAQSLKPFGVQREHITTVQEPTAVSRLYCAPVRGDVQ